MGIAFLVLPFLPASNLLFYVGFVMAERVLYLPSVGYCLLFGLGFGSLWQRANGSRRSRMMLLCGLGLLLGVHGLRTMRRNLDWRDEEQLFRSAISVNPPKGECLCYIYNFINFFWFNIYKVCLQLFKLNTLKTFFYIYLKLLY